MKKRVLSIVLSIVILVSLLPTTALAEDPHTGHAVGDGSIVTSWETWTGTAALEDGKSYYLTADTEIGNVTISGTVNLCLNGHTLTSGGSGSGVLTVSGSGTLNLCSCTNGGTIKRTDASKNIPLIYARSGARVNLYDVTLDGGAVWSGTEDSVLGRGTTNSGIASSKPLIDSGSQQTPGGHVTLNEGVVLQNNSCSYAGHGGAVTIGEDGSLAINGAVICNNAKTDGQAGAIKVYAGASVTMNSGAIYGNQAYTHGGAIQIFGGDSTDQAIVSFTMTDGTIHNNKAGAGGTNGVGGGVAVSNYSAFIMNGGSITGNSCGSSGKGGGVAFADNNTSMEISGSAEITGNTKSGASNNLEIGTSTYNLLEVTGALSGTIGINRTNNNTSVFTKKTGSVSPADYINHFTSDNAGYVVAVDGENLKLATSSAVCTVSFNVNGGTGAMGNVPVETGGTYTLPSCTFTPPAGKQFVGWAQAANGEVISKETITVDANTTLYAVWEDAPVETHSHDMSVACGSTAPVTYEAWDGTDGLPGDNVYLTESVTLNSTITVSSGTVNLCLNGHNIEKSTGSAIKVNSGATLNICDCSEGETGSIASASDNSEFYGTIKNSGTVNVYGGTVSVDGTSSRDYSSGICNEGSNSTVNVYGGTVSGTGSAGISVSGIYNYNNNAAVYVYGGEVTGADHGIYNNGTTTVSGGEVCGTSSGININRGTVTVSGGTISGTGDTGYGINNWGYSLNLSGAPTITGAAAAIGLQSSGYITIGAGGLSNTAPYIVKTRSAPTTGSPIKIAAANDTDYSAKFAPADSASYKIIYDTDKCLYLAVKSVPVNGVTLAQSSFTLDVGDSTELTATVSPNDATVRTVSWTSDNTDVATVDEDGKVTAVAPGSATITATANDGSGKTATCTVTVRKNLSAADFIFTAPSGNGAGNIIYDGTGKAATVTAPQSTGTVTVYYKAGNGDWTTTAPTAAGTYQVKIDVAAGDTYASASGLTDDLWKFTIAPVSDKVTVTITENSGTGTYDGTEKTVTGYTVSIDNDLYTEADFTFNGDATVKGTNAGTYSMGLMPENFTNINNNFSNVVFDIVDGALTITPKEISIASASIKPVTYDPNGYTLEVSSVTFNGTVTTYTATAEFTDSNKTPGNRSVRVTVTLTASNYSLSSATFETTVSVSAAAPTVTEPTAKTGLVYDGNAQDLIKAGSSEHGHWEYSLDGTTYSTAIPAGTDAKTYTVSCKFVPNEGYDGTELLTLSVTIAPMEVDEPTVVGTYTYTGSEQTVELDGVLGCMTVSGNKATVAGDYVVSISLDGNHKWNAESDGKIAWSIGAKTVTPTVALEYASIVYSGSERKPTVTVKDGDTEIPVGEYAVAYVNNVNVGTATVTITDKEKGNYTFAEITKTFEIMRDGVSPVVTMDDYEYDGTPAVPSVSGNNGSGTVTVYYSTDSSKVDKLWEDISGTTLNVGTYYMKAHVAATDNYAEGISPIITFKVTPSKYEAPSAPAASEFTVTVNEADRGKILEYSLDGTNWINVPALTNGAFELKGLTESTQYTVYLRVKASADGNYQASDAVSTVWTTPARYSVAYHANLGTGSVPASVTQNSGRSVTVARGSGLKRTGYTFAGWNTAADGTGADYAPGSTISTGATLYAKWTANSYTVKFKANGGSGTMGDQNFTYDTAQALNSSAFTRDGYHFVGWALSSGNTAIYMDSQTVKNLSDKGTVTLHAVWAEDVYNIGVDFSSNSNHPIIAKLMRGDAQIGSTQSVTMSGTDAPYTGHFDFTGVPKGIYNIVAEQDGKVMTKLIIITDHDDTVEITIPSSVVNSVLEVSEDTLPVVVGGLEDEAVTKAEESKTVTITMTVEKQEEQQLPDNASESEKATQEAILEIKEEGSDKTFEFMDIEVAKKVEGTGQAAVEEKLTETNKVMEIVIPFDLTGKMDITVYRHHNGKTEQFAENTTKADGTFYIDEVNHLIHVFSQKFSTYAIGYTEPAPYYPPVVSVHTCTSKCDVCGGCEDAKCTQSACKDKCLLLGMNFTDVADGKWYTEPVAYVYHHGMMEGVGNNLFDINGTTTRAMIVTILWRLESEPVVNYLMDFEDVPSDIWYTEAIRWAQSEGVVEGYGNGKFGTNDPITREQFAAILWRYAKSKGYDVSVGEDTNILSYEDAFTVSEYAIPAMQWACGSGLMQGDGVNLTPKAYTTRAQAAALFQRFCENVAEK